MGIRGPRDESTKRTRRDEEQAPRMPLPSASYRRRAWVKFQRALDPLAPIKPLPPRRP
jgi:hypothetical protein